MSESVTILIKAPNQMIDDQSIECERGWTVGELKQHLSQVYPTKPHPLGQKLIYSGKLLPDRVILADVLKTYGDQENHTIHLVCATKENKTTTQAEPAASTSSLNSSASSSSSSNLPQGRSRSPRSPFYQPWQWPTENGNPSPNLTNFTYENYQFYLPSFPIPSNVSAPITYPFDMPEEIWNRQMMLIRQAYSQYMTQLRDMPNNVRFDPRYFPEAAQPQNPQPPPQNNALEDDTDDDGAANRDWLEWVFFICRIVVLFSIVYFYSSPSRFLFVMSMTILLLYVNVDIERLRRRNVIPENPPQEATANPANQRPNRRNPIPFMWTFVSSFFLSMFPGNEDFI